jgi:hypothetical protein
LLGRAYVFKYVRTGVIAHMGISASFSGEVVKAQRNAIPNAFC